MDIIINEIFSDDITICQQMKYVNINDKVYFLDKDNIIRYYKYIKDIIDADIDGYPFACIVEFKEEKNILHNPVSFDINIRCNKFLYIDNCNKCNNLAYVYEDNNDFVFNCKCITYKISKISYFKKYKENTVNEYNKKLIIELLKDGFMVNNELNSFDVLNAFEAFFDYMCEEFSNLPCDIDKHFDALRNILRNFNMKLLLNKKGVDEN